MPGTGRSLLRCWNWARIQHSMWYCGRFLCKSIPLISPFEMQLIFLSQIENVFVPAVGDRDDNDLRQTAPGSFPPEFYLTFLRSPTVKALIGANSTYRECANAPDALFSKTGDVCIPSVDHCWEIALMTKRMRGHYYRNLLLWSTPDSKRSFGYVLFSSVK